MLQWKVLSFSSDQSGDRIVSQNSHLIRHLLGTLRWQYWIPDTTMNLPFHFTVSVNYHSDHGKVQVRCWCQTPSIDAELKFAPI